MSDSATEQQYKVAIKQEKQYSIRPLDRDDSPYLGPTGSKTRLLGRDRHDVDGDALV